MPVWSKKQRRYKGLKLPGNMSDDQFDRAIRLEYAKWPQLAAAAFFAVLAFLSALLHVDDAKGVYLEFSDWLTARGGLALGFIALAAWAVYWSRPEVIVGEQSPKD